MPKTRFRDSLASETNKTDTNAAFFYYGTLITKYFYVWAKWFIGFYFNYLRYMNRVSSADVQEMYRLLLFSAFATTISMFLHTLKFKRYMSAKIAFLLYMGSYSATFYSIVRMYTLFVDNNVLVALTSIGMLLNYFGDRLMCGSVKWREVPCALWQMAVMVVLYGARAGWPSLHGRV